MTESLESVKQRLSHLYLGKCGIHGLGIRRSQNALCIYVNSKNMDSAHDLASVLPEVERQATPYRVIVIKEEPSSIT